MCVCRTRPDGYINKALADKLTMVHSDFRVVAAAGLGYITPGSWLNESI